MNRTLTATIAGLVLGGALLTGCGDDEGDADPGTDESTSATASPSESEPTDGESSGATDDPTASEPDDTDDPTEVAPTDSTDAPETEDTGGPTNPEAAELCDAYKTAFEAFEDLGDEFDGEDREQVPPALIDALRTWGEDLAAAELPSDMTDDQRAGVGVQVDLLEAIPDRITFGELDDLEDELSENETDQSNAATEYATANCQLY